MLSLGTLSLDHSLEGPSFEIYSLEGGSLEITLSRDSLSRSLSRATLCRDCSLKGRAVALEIAPSRGPRSRDRSLEIGVSRNPLSRLLSRARSHMCPPLSSALSRVRSLWQIRSLEF